MTKEFNQFWEAYPKKKAKLDAYKAWGQMDKKFGIANGAFDEVMKALNVQVELFKGKDLQFFPYPASWLRSGRWLDEPEEQSKWKVV